LRQVPRKFTPMKLPASARPPTPQLGFVPPLLPVLVDARCTAIMTLKQLEAFYLASTLGSFALAAKRLHVTQSSLSRAHQTTLNLRAAGAASLRRTAGADDERDVHGAC